MKTQDIYTSDKKETGTALTFMAILFLLLLAVTNLTAAPVSTDRFGSYRAECTNNEAIIKWNVTDDNADHYTIERTQDGVHYELIGDVQAIQGLSTHQYSVIDNTPLTGISYYRISQFSDEGKQTYLNTVVYTPCENNEDIEGFNTSTDVFIQINAKSDDTCSITITSVDGKTILSQNRKVSMGLNNYKIEPKVEKGVYVLYVTYHNLKFNKVLVLESSMAK
jgi:hypothetical protein